MSRVTKIISLPIPRFDPSFPPPIIATCENILPSPFSRQFISRGIQQPISVVKYTTASVLALSLQKLGAIREMARKCADYGLAKVWNEWMSAVSDEIRKRIPDFQNIIKMHAEALSSHRIKMDALGDVSIDAEEEASKLLLVMSLKLFRGYSKEFPTFVAESRFEYGKLIPNDLTTLPVELVQAIIGVIGDVQSSFKWWQTAPSSNGRSNDMSYLGIFLSLYINSTTPPQLKHQTRQLLKNVLTSSFLFQTHTTEASLLLTCLDEIPQPQQKSAANFICDALCQAMKDVHAVAEVVQETIQKAETEMSTPDMTLYAAKNRRAGMLPIAPGVICLAIYGDVNNEKNKAIQQEWETVGNFLVMYMTRVFWATQSCPNYMTHIVRVIKEEDIRYRLLTLVEAYSGYSMDIDRNKSKTIQGKCQSSNPSNLILLDGTTKGYHEDEESMQLILKLMSCRSTAFVPISMYGKLPVSFLLQHLFAASQSVPMEVSARITSTLVPSLLNQTLLELYKRYQQNPNDMKIVVSVLSVLVDTVANTVVADMILNHPVVQKMYLDDTNGT